MARDELIHLGSQPSHFLSCSPSSQTPAFVSATLSLQFCPKIAYVFDDKRRGRNMSEFSQLIFQFNDRFCCCADLFQLSPYSSTRAVGFSDCGVKVPNLGCLRFGFRQTLPNTCNRVRILRSL